jgi:hypothetical protein
VARKSRPLGNWKMEIRNSKLENRGISESGILNPGSKLCTARSWFWNLKFQISNPIADPAEERETKD